MPLVTQLWKKKKKKEESEAYVQHSYNCVPRLKLQVICAKKEDASHLLLQ